MSDEGSDDICAGDSWCVRSASVCRGGEDVSPSDHPSEEASQSSSREGGDGTGSESEPGSAALLVVVAWRCKIPERTSHPGG